MKCRNCGREINDTAAFCGHCNAIVKPEQRKIAPQRPPVQPPVMTPPPANNQPDDSTPVYRKYLFDAKDTSLENVLVTAVINVKNTFGIISGSFGQDLNEQTISFAVKYVQKAIRHYDNCMQTDEVNVHKRENEYDNIMMKLKARWRMEE